MNNNNSTSFHTINYDKPLSFGKKLIWFFFNFINNLFINRHLDKNLNFKNFNYSLSKLYFDKVSYELSPLRFLSNLFWMSVPWKNIIDNIGNLKILEIGSGTGKYGIFFNSLLNKNLLNYTGVDLKQNTIKNIPENFKFHIDTCDNVTNYIQDHNVLITMTAIEHFENDLSFFKKIKQHLDKTKQELIQIHVMPAFPCLKTYLGHGLRQYSPSTLSKITRLYSGNDLKILIPLGNKEFNKLTFKFITLPRIFKSIDKRKSNFNFYKKSLNKLLSTQINDSKPTAYALVICTNLNKKLNFNNDKVN